MGAERLDECKTKHISVIVFTTFNDAYSIWQPWSWLKKKPLNLFKWQRGHDKGSWEQSWIRKPEIRFSRTESRVLMLSRLLSAFRRFLFMQTWNCLTLFLNVINFSCSNILSKWVQLWRGYIQRKKTKIIREEEMIFLGMVSELNHVVPTVLEYKMR